MFRAVAVFAFTLILLVAPHTIPASAQTPAPVPDDAVAAFADDYFTRFAAARGFSGAVLILRDGETLLDRGYGLADDASATPVTSDTVFDVASLSKQFTATAVLQLVAAGTLALDAPISRYFDDVPLDKAGITVHQLLTHTSGLTEHAEGDFEPLARDEALARIFGSPLAFAPGARYTYSNSGYTVLAALVETTTDTPFTDVMHTRVFAPAGLASTGFYDDDWADLPVATAYASLADYPSPPSSWGVPQWTVLGNGGVMSTTGDLARWWAAVLSGDVLPPAETALLFTPHAAEGDLPDVYYGYGWVVAPSPLGAQIWHNGGGAGGNSHFAAVTLADGRELVIIVLGNRLAYEEMFGIPCRFELYATEAVDGLIANLASGATLLPEPTLSVC